MTGHAMPWNKEPSGQQKEDAQKQRELVEKQSALEKRQEAEMKSRKKRLNAQAIAMLRSRFGVSGSARGDSGGNVSAPQEQSQDSASLFSQITGR